MKKAISLILCVAIILSVSSFYSYAIEDEPTTISKEFYQGNGGYIDFRYVDENGNEIKKESFDKYDPDSGIFTDYKNPDVVGAGSEPLPAKYDSRDLNRVTPVKSQSPFGTCWAFAFCAAAESSLIAQGYETKDSVDLSEAHLVYFTGNNRVEGSTNPVHQDYYNFSKNIFSNGGNNEYAMGTVARGSGFTTEEKFPYKGDVSLMEYDVDEMFESEYSLVSARQLDPNDFAAIKASIMKYGALATNMYSDDSFFKKSDAGYSYYQNIKNGSTNHAVTVVGWDDNFSASNFKVNPGKDGAWLIKNSWGTGFHDRGYFWMSYEDLSTTTFCEVVAKPKDYGDIYQYDGISCFNGFGYNGQTLIANIFTATADETITSCGFQVFDAANYTYTVSLYKNCSATKPSSGTLLESKTIDCFRPGFYTVDFANKHQISAGERFSVVLKCYNNAGSSAPAWVSIEKTRDQFVYSAQAGQSFYSYSGSSWTDLTTYDSSGNAAIKAYTEAKPEPTELVIETLPDTVYMVGESLDLTNLKVNLLYSDNTSVDVDNSLLTVTDFNSAVAGIQSISLAYNGFTATFDVNVFDYDSIINIESSDAKINPEAKVLSNVSPDIKSLGSVLILNDGFTCSTNEIATDGEVRFYYNGEYLASLFTLIYGDVNRDGSCDGMDCVLINCYVNSLLSDSDLTALQIAASDCSRDGAIDELDVLAVGDAGLYLSAINQS